MPGVSDGPGSAAHHFTPGSRCARPAVHAALRPGHTLILAPMRLRGRSTHPTLCQPAKGREEAVDILLVVVDVRADAHAPDAGCDVDLLRRQPFDQLLRHAVRKFWAQDMR